MLVVVHHPFTDVRPFLSADTGRLQKPVWSNVGKRDFVRGCGHIKRKRLGGVPGEVEPEDGKLVDSVFCSLHHALSFGVDVTTFHGGNPWFPGVAGAFRRLLVMPEEKIMTSPARRAEIVGRAEIGLRVRRSRRPNPAAVLSVVNVCARIPVRVPSSNPSKPMEVALLAAGPSLASHLLRSTTRISFLEAPGVQNDWLTAGPPLLIAETNPEDPWSIEAGERGGGWQRFEMPPEAKIEVLHRTVEFDGEDIPFWLLRLDKGADKDCARRLRIYLARMHARRAALEQVLSLLQQRRLTLSPSSEATAVNNEPFLLYIERCISELSKRKAYGFSQPDAQRLAYHYNSVVSGSDRDDLLEMLKSVNPTLAGRVGRYTANGGRADGGGAVKVLFVTSNADGDAARLAEFEHRRLLQTLAQRAHLGAIESVSSPAVDLATLQGDILGHNPDVLHFASANERGITLLGENREATRFEPEKIREVFGELFKQADVRLRGVMLSRCYSPEQAAALRAHVDFVVGTEAAMPEQLAEGFIARFYDTVGFGKDVGAAFRLARTVVEDAAAITHFDLREGVEAAKVHLVQPFEPHALS